MAELEDLGRNMTLTPLSSIRNNGDDEGSNQQGAETMGHNKPCVLITGVPSRVVGVPHSLLAAVCRVPDRGTKPVKHCLYMVSEMEVMC